MSYICDISKEQPARDTFGILEGKDAAFKGHHCTHTEGTRVALEADTAMTSEVKCESCNKPSSLKSGMLPSFFSSILPFCSSYIPLSRLFSSLIFSSHHLAFPSHHSFFLPVTRNAGTKDTFGVLAGKDACYFGGESQGETLMHKWSREN